MRGMWGRKGRESRRWESLIKGYKCSATVKAIDSLAIPYFSNCQQKEKRKMDQKAGMFLKLFR